MMMVGKVDQVLIINSVVTISLMCLYRPSVSDSADRICSVRSSHLPARAPRGWLESGLYVFMYRSSLVRQVIAV